MKGKKEYAKFQRVKKKANTIRKKEERKKERKKERGSDNARHQNLIMCFNEVGEIKKKREEKRKVR